MLQYILIIIFLLQSFVGVGQLEDFSILSINLPEELSAAHQEFSGLAIQRDYLYLLSESRIQEGREGKIYRIRIADIDQYLQDTTYLINFEKLELKNLNYIVSKINGTEGKYYEGLEAMVIVDTVVYLSVETENPCPNNYIITALLDVDHAFIDTSLIVEMPKPKTEKGEFIYNAGIEAMAVIQDTLWTFFEFNYFDRGNNAKLINQKYRFEVPLEPLPFRLTDVCAVENNSGFSLIGVNYFYKGAGKDTVYRVPAYDRMNYILVNEQNAWHNFCRLVQISYKNDALTWTPIWNFPESFYDYNWEGLAAYRDGYFLVNDKYDPANERVSKLIYLQRK